MNGLDDDDPMAGLFGSGSGGRRTKRSHKHSGGRPFGSFGGNGGSGGSFDDLHGFGQNSGTGTGRGSEKGKKQENFETIWPLEVPLEEMMRGKVKKMKTTRTLLNGTKEEKMLEVPIKAGLKAGSKIKFAAGGNEELNQYGVPQSRDLVFQISEKPHDTFSRDGDDLIYKYSIPLREALIGPSSNASNRKFVPHLDGTQVSFTIPYPSSKGGVPIKPGQEVVIDGKGFPITRKGTEKDRGDLKIRFDVKFPDKIGEESARHMGLAFN